MLKMAEAHFLAVKKVVRRARCFGGGAAGCFFEACILGARNTLPPISGVGWNYCFFVEIFKNLISPIFFSLDK